MTEAQLSTTLMIGVFALAPAIIAVLAPAGWLLSRFGRDSRVGRATLRIVGFGGIAGVSLFIGTMIATAGGAIHPDLLNVAVPYVCEGEGPADTVSTPYSYRPGQQGVSRQIFCPRPDGTGEDRTLHVVVTACLIYGLLAFGFFMFLVLVRKAVRLLRARSA
jgi:hypothetical protein